MPTNSWNTGASGLWATPTNWSLGTVPVAADDVVIDAVPTSGAYTVTIAPGETDTVNSLTMNGTNNLSGTNSNPYDAARLELGGTLAFAPGSPGLLGGSLQTIIHTVVGTTTEILNPGTLNAFIEAEGNLVLTGTNGLYITNWLQALGSTVTVDTSTIAELNGTQLFDGIFEAQSPGATVNLGGPLHNLAVDIATVAGPPAIPEGWTELIFNGPDTHIQEWNGNGYVSVETSLQTIASRGTVDVLAGRNYETGNTLTVAAGGLLNLHVGTFTAAGLDNSGIVQGFGTIAPNVANNGTLVAEGGTLVVAGNLTGTGTIKFDYDQRLDAAVPGGATLELHAASAGQTVFMSGDDTLQLDGPTTFLGRIAAQIGDAIILKNDDVTSATITNGTLTLSNNQTLALSGDYTGEHFTSTYNGTDTTLTLAAGAQNPTGPGPGNPTSPGGTPTSPGGTKPAPSSEFDPAYYLAHNPDVAAAHLDPYAHYEQYGWKEGRNPDAVFDVKYYLNQNPDVKAAGIDPLTQYEQFGWKEGRDPSSTFSTQSYLQANPDVAAAHADPLQHYLAHGMTEGRMAFLATPHATGTQNPLVDNNYYFSQNADVRAAGVNPFTHYDASGWKEGRNPDALFDTKYYLQNNPDVAAAHIDPLLHFERTGWQEGRNPSADFSTSKYLAANPDVRATGIDPLVHYEQYGMHEGRAIYHT